MKKMYIALFSIFLISVVSCNNNAKSQNKPQFVYKADFKPSDISILIKSLENISHDLGTTIYEKNRDDMRYLSSGKEAFSIFYYYENDDVMFISNVGSGKKLTLVFVDHGKMPIKIWNKMKTLVFKTLKENGATNLELKKET